MLLSMLTDIESCIRDLETKEVFIIQDLPRTNERDRLYNKCVSLITKIDKLKDKIIDIEFNNTKIPEQLEKELKEKKVFMDRTIMVSKAFGTMRTEGLVEDDINKISDFLNGIIDFTKRLEGDIRYLENKKNDIKNIQNSELLLKIGNVRFYFADKELSKISWGANMYDEVVIKKKSDFEKYGLIGKNREALRRLYAIAKQYDKDIENNVFVFGFLDKTSQLNYETFGRFNMISKRKDQKKDITSYKEKYATVMSSLRRLSERNGWGINIPKKNQISNKWNNFNLKKGIKYVVEII